MATNESEKQLQSGASARRKSRAEERLPAGLGTLFVGLLLIVLAFVEGDSVMEECPPDVLFGLFGCGSFVLGAAVCYLAILYTRGAGPADAGVQAGAGADLCQRHGHRVFGYPAAADALPR